MNIFRSYKRTRFFLWINIAGLAIGLSASIMLILFIVNELSYDKHFANKERIVTLYTVASKKGDESVHATSVREAYTGIPSRIPEIEAATQILSEGKVTVKNGNKKIKDNLLLCVEPGFFDVFRVTFVEGMKDAALRDLKSVVMTRKKAEAIFGTSRNVVGREITMNDESFTITAVIEGFPDNTHFSFDLLKPLGSINLQYFKGVDFHTYYLLDKQSHFADANRKIEAESVVMMQPWAERNQCQAYCKLEKLTDIYFNTTVKSGLGTCNNPVFTWLMLGLSLFIFILAITNFVNMFLAQGETRMMEIGLRKTNGASVHNIVKMFFSEVSIIVLIAILMGLMIVIIMSPAFGVLIGKKIEITQLLNPIFIVSIVVLFIVTVSLSASYPAFYLSRFNPLPILERRISFSKHKLTTCVVIFQSFMSILLITLIFVIRTQTTYLEKLPLGYNPQNIVCVNADDSMIDNYASVRQELLSFPELDAVSGGEHTIGNQGSGQSLKISQNNEEKKFVNQYRLMPGVCELFDIKLVEGKFFEENAPDSIPQILLNQAAVKMLELKPPIIGQHLFFRREVEIIGVVADFYYQNPARKIEPLMMTRTSYPGTIFIKYNPNVNRTKIQEVALAAFRKFDPEYIVDARWAEDIYLKNFETLRMQARIIFIASVFSVIIAMMGLLAIHLYSAMRRNKEIAVRRVNGANKGNILALLSKDFLLWIIIAGIIAIPISYYMSVEWLANFANRTTLSWVLFMCPIIIQCIIAIIVTTGVSIRAVSKNPVDSLKSE